MKPRLLIAGSVLALAACAVGPDGKFGGSGVVLRSDQRPVVRRVEAPEPPPESKPPVAPVVAAAPETGDPSVPVDDRLPPPAAATDHVPKPWPFDVRNYVIDLSIDPARHAISGRVTIDVDDAADGLAELPLDAVDMRISRVTQTASSSESVTFAYDGRTLRIPLDEPRKAGTQRSFAIEYAATPTRGIYFNDGDPPQVYTQGECEDSRYWFPCHDAPDDRATHTITTHAPAGWTVVGAGASPAAWFAQRVTRAVRYGLDIPHVAYLTSMTAGEYEVIEERGEVPLQYVVEKRDAPYAAANFRKTNEILRFFGDYTGLPYPYPKYSQTCVRNFMFGGMENISATTLTDHTIHPPDWEPARDSSSLVAHEAAHQWFGDWITCSDWSHCWLNEGFATYFDLLFTEHDQGRDAFLWELRGARHGALSAMDSKRRAVVSNRYADPFDLFDGHAYPGGAVRLHMLRHLLGDDAFREAIRHYVKVCGLRCIRTEDFKAAVEESGGLDLAWFFDQWFMKPGYPVLKVRWRWDEAKKAEIVTVEQTQKAEGGVPEAYRLALDIGFDLDRKYPELGLVRRFELTRRSEAFEIPLPSKPLSVHPDPETRLLARFDLERSAADLQALMHRDPNPSARLDAAEALGAIVRDEKRSAPDRDAAFEALLVLEPAESFAPARAAFLGQVASRKDERTAQSLISTMDHDPDLRVRLAAADALHGFDGNAAARDALARHLEDANDLLRASAVAGIAKLKHPKAFESLLAQVERPGWQSVVRKAALRGLGDLGDERAFATLVRFAEPGDNWARGTAIEQLGRMGKKRPEYRAAVLPFLDDRERGVRQAAANALGAMADPESLAPLAAHFATETWPGVKDAIREAVKKCRAAAVEEGRLLSVEAIRIAPIRERHAEVREELDALKASLAGLAGDTKTAAEAKVKPLADDLGRLRHELDALGVPEKPKPKPPVPTGK